MAGPSEQRRVTYSGHVQGVGFRYTTRNLASSFDVTGYVKNLHDGRVELIAEGLSPELNEFLAEIRRHFAGQIRDESTDIRPASGQFDAFEIRH
ncbi:MAG: acylphosphatase [Pirellulales bacterium]